MADANIRIPVDARDRLAAIAAGEGLSLRAYLARLAGDLLTPEERAEHAAQARRVLKEWNGYDPTPEEEKALDAEIYRRLGLRSAA
jgi:hypothetical protein